LLRKSAIAFKCDFTRVLISLQKPVSKAVRGLFADSDVNILCFVVVVQTIYRYTLGKTELTSRLSCLHNACRFPAPVDGSVKDAASTF
jgi:hypothetical protein